MNSAGPESTAGGLTRIGLLRDGDRPLYQQLRHALEHEIASGTLDVRAALPSSRELAQELGLSRNTVNAAYQELQAEGIVSAEPRRGLFVNQEMLSHLHRGTDERDERHRVDWSRHLPVPNDAELPEIAKVRDWDRYPYPFVSGQLDDASFPRLAWVRALREALDPPHLHVSLRDAVDEDDPMLVEGLCRQVLPSRGIEVDPDQVLITLGTQHGLDLLSRTLLAGGDRVVVEDPGYPDARHIFTRAGAAVTGLPVDASGLVVPADLAGVRLVYVTPSHHSPTNVTLSRPRRAALLQQAQRDDVLIVEDDYDSEFRYRGGPTVALKALPGSDRVIYLGTFSKFFAPGLRLGYLVGAAELVAELRRQRRYQIRHVPGHTQRAMALMIDQGQYHRTVRRHRGELQRKWTVLRDALNAQLPWPCDPTAGGVSIWVTGPPELDCVHLAGAARRRGVILERGDVYFADPEQHRHHFRLGFGAIPLSAIEPGVRELAAAVAEVLP